MRTTTTAAPAKKLVVALWALGASSPLLRSNPSVGVGVGVASAENVFDQFPEPRTYPVPALKSRWLTLDEWNVYLESESGTEFEYDEDPERARALWDDAVKFEWGRCLMEERLGTGKNCSYVVCHAGRGESGHGRKKALFGHIPGGPDAARDLIYQTVWNSRDAWCGFGGMAATLAAGIGCGDDSGGGGGCESVVTPMMMSMKMMPETIGRLIGAIEELYGTSDLTELTDGSRMRKRRKLERKMRQQRTLRTLQDGDEDEEVGDNGDPEQAEREGGADSRGPRPIEDLPAVDIYLAPGVINETDLEALAAGGDASNADITEAMTYWLVSQTGSADPTKANGTTNVAVEATYWTSSRAADASEKDDTDRARFWRDVFKLTLETTVCDDTYKSKLIWTGDLRLKPDYSILTARYNDTDAREIDQWCVVAMVASLATHVDVVALEIRPGVEQHNVNAAWLVQSGLEGEFPWFEQGLDGRGQVVAVSDTGIDANNCYFWDKDNPISQSHRKIVEYNPSVDDSDYQYGHGTHVAGTIVGKKASDGVTESAGTADGVAKGAKVAFIDIGDSNGGLYLPGDWTILGTGRSENLPPDQKAHIHSASWGSVGINYYSSQARSFDNYMFDNPDFLINVAAGNDGRGDAFNTVSSPATFKNGLAVGCSHSTGYDLANGMLGPSYIADFSSKGPTADGRMTPMLVAPGKYILSAGALPDQEGECDDGIPDAGGGRAGLKSMAGTSMATPVVSGHAALVQQYFREGWYPSGRKNPADAMQPSAALVKAVLMNGAQTKNMRGVDNGGQVTGVKAYDNVMGFGAINLIKSLYVEGWSDVQAKVWDGEVVADGGMQPYEVTVDRSNGCAFEDLSVTLVWVEKAGAMGCAKCVVNDLDLAVIDISSGEKYFPNGRSDRDDTNNAERVVVQNVDEGATYKITVEGYNLDDPEQTYALVATGCFGGVGNQLDTTNDAFKTDDSANDRRNMIIIVVCSVVGGLLVLCLCGFLVKRRRDAKGA